MTDTTFYESITPVFNMNIPIGALNGLPEFSCDPLIDAVTIMDFDITYIRNLDALFYAGVASYDTKLNYCYYTQAGECFTEVKLFHQDLFDSLVFKTNRHHDKIAYMSISIGNLLYHNLYCFSIEQYRLRLDDIKAYLFETYGIGIDFSNSRFHTIEINKTFLLSEECKYYQRPLAVIFSAFPKSLRLGDAGFRLSEPGAADDGCYRQSFCRSSGNRGLEVKAYNKGKQLKSEKGIYIPELKDRCLRFEIKLKHQQKINRELKTDKVYEITDQDVYEYFERFVNKNIVEAINSWNEYRCDKLRAIVNECINSDGVFLNCEHILLRVADAEIQSGGIPLILDAVELLQIIDEVRPFASRQAKRATSQRLNEVCVAHIPTFSNGDNDRLVELVNMIRVIP